MLQQQMQSPPAGTWRLRAVSAKAQRARLPRQYVLRAEEAGDEPQPAQHECGHSDSGFHQDECSRCLRGPAGTAECALMRGHKAAPHLLSLSPRVSLDTRAKLDADFLTCVRIICI
jgi:hypothetical protein